MHEPPRPADPSGHLPGNLPEQCEGFDLNSGVNSSPPLPDESAPPAPPASASVAERDAYWRKHVYLGDSQLQLTWRAVLIGGITGGLLSVTGLFITLKTGWGLPLTVIATLGTYSVMNALTRLSGGKIRPFTMLENNCMTSTATAASASTGMTIVGCFGGLLLVAPAASDGVVRNPPMLAVGAVVFFTALLGICLAIPLKRRMVNDEDLPFPSPRAGAEILKSLYADGRSAAMKARALFITLALGGALGLMRSLEGVAETFSKSDATSSLHRLAKFGVPEEFPFKPHRLIDGFSWTLRKISFGRIDFPTLAAELTMRGVSFEPSLLLTAVGLIVGLRTALSMLLGSVVLYFVLTPLMLHSDELCRLALGGDATALERFKPALAIKAGVVSPASWGLWGGTALLLSSSFVGLALQGKTIVRSFTSVFVKKTAGATDAVADLEVPMKWAVIGGIPCAVGLTISLWAGFGVNPALGLLALVISCLVAVVCARTAAETDINPIGAMGKVTQLTYAKLPGASGDAAINLVAAGATSAAGGSAVDMIADLKTSRLLGANPRKVWLAQFSGVFFGIVCVVPAWYALIPDRTELEKYSAIPAQMWSAVAKFLTGGKEAFYNGAPTLMIVCAIIGAVIPLAAHFFPKLGKRLPSALGLGIGLALPLSNTMAFGIGALAMWLWETGHKKSALFYGLVIASGLMSGQAIVESIVTLICQAWKLFHP